MEILFEFDPVESREELLARLRVLKDLVDWIDVPDSPMGKPRQSSPVVSCLLKSLGDAGVVAHIRTIDYSRIAFWSTLKSLVFCGVERVVLVRGDIVSSSTVVRDIEPDNAVLAVKQQGINISPGLTLSLRKELPEILKRIGIGADFYLLLNLSSKTFIKLREVAKITKGFNIKIYPYLVVATENNYGVLTRVLSEEKIVRVEEALEIADSCRELVNGFLISSPLDFRGAINIIQRLRKKL